MSPGCFERQNQALAQLSSVTASWEVRQRNVSPSWGHWWLQLACGALATQLVLNGVSTFAVLCPQNCWAVTLGSHHPEEKMWIECSPPSLPLHHTRQKSLL